MIENPVFIVGTERSGSNLLRLLLNELPELTIPHPPHLMRDLSRIFGKDRHYDNPAEFRALVDAAVRLVDLHFAPWPIRLNSSDIIASVPRRDLYSVYATIYERYREHMRKPRWGCKSTFMVRHVPEILSHHRAPQLIHLVRDPRDVAVSARKSIFSHYHPYFVARLWRDEQREAARWARELPPQTWFTLRYEDLIRDPAQSLRAVCSFLQSTYSDRLLRFFDKPAARELSALSRSWENVARPVLQSNSEKYRRLLSASEIKLIENIAGPEMRSFGYATEFITNETSLRTEKLTTLARYYVADTCMMWREEGKALFTDRNALRRLAKKSYLFSLKRFTRRRPASAV